MYKQYLIRWLAGTFFLQGKRARRGALRAAKTFQIVDSPSFAPDDAKTIGWECSMEGKKYGNWVRLTNDDLSQNEQDHLCQILAVNAQQSIASIYGISWKNPAYKTILQTTKNQLGRLKNGRA